MLKKEIAIVSSLYLIIQFIDIGKQYGRLKECRMFEVDNKQFKTAIVHDWFCNMGGADKCVEIFLDLMPDSPVYTSCYLESSLTPRLKAASIKVSFLQRYLDQKKDNHQNFLPLMPAAFESFDMNEYDIVLSSSSCCAKGVITRPGAIHICYCHTPMRYAWEYFNEYTENMKPLKHKIVSIIMNYIRIWDVISASRVDYFLANSQNVANRIWKHYRRKATVVYPPVETEYFTPGNEDGDFYLCVSRLVKYKKVDLAVKACNQLKLPLVVFGQGAEYKRLKKLAGNTVRLMGKQSDEVIRDYYRRCKAFLFPGEEDFGMTPLEAQACGRPVIAYGKGGALETVIDGQTGVFFKEQTVESLIEAIKRLDSINIDKSVCRKNAEKFSVQVFKERLCEEIEKRCRDGYLI